MKVLNPSDPKINIKFARGDGFIVYNREFDCCVCGIVKNGYPLKNEYEVAGFIECAPPLDWGMIENSKLDIKFYCSICIKKL